MEGWRDGGMIRERHIIVGSGLHTSRCKEINAACKVISLKSVGN